MSSGNDDKPGKKPPEQRDGVRHDVRGNAVWQWAVDTGKHARDSTSRLLKRLEVPGLKLEDEATTPGAKPGADPKVGAGPGSAGSRAPAKPWRAGGYDPYGGARPVAPKKPAAAPPPRRSLWQRLFRKD